MNSSMEYKFRGWKTLCFAVSCVVGACISVIKYSYLSMAIELLMFVWFLLRFWKKRNMSEQEWEKAYGKRDERDDAINGRAARLTLKAGVFILIVLNSFVFSTPREVAASVALTVACAAIYACSKEYYEERM